SSAAEASPWYALIPRMFTSRTPQGLGNPQRLHRARYRCRPMAPVRTTIVTSIMAPHRIALFNALAEDPRVDLTVVYLARSDPSRQWDPREEEMRFRYRPLREWGRVRRGEGYVHLTSGLTPILRSAAPDVLVVGGWDQLAYQLVRLAYVRSG